VIRRLDEEICRVRDIGEGGVVSGIGILWFSKSTGTIQVYHWMLDVYSLIYTKGKEPARLK
jgi:hypothetical protein